MLAIPHAASAQSSDSATADAQAVIVRPLTFFLVQDLDFGSIVPGTTAGTVIVHPNGTRTHSGGVTPVGSDYQEARFAGRGTYNQLLRVRLDSNTIYLTGPGTRMTVRNFMIGSDPPSGLSTSWSQFRIGSTYGILNFPIGATLDVNARQNPGVYTGTFRVTLEYQ